MRVVRRWYVWLPISIGIFALLVWRTRPWEAADLAARLDLALLAAALLLNVAVVAAWALRSESLMSAVGSPLSLRALVPVVTFANTVNNLTPASAGEVLRAIILKSRHGVPYGHSAAVILAERLWAIGLFLITALAAAVGTLITADAILTASAWLAAVALAFSPSIAYRLGLRPGRAARWLSNRAGSKRLRWAAEALVEVDNRMADIVLRPKTAIWFVLSTGLVVLTFAAQLWLILLAFGSALPIAGVWAAYGLAICAGVISALPFGLGAADAVLVVLLVAQGVPAPTAGAAAMVLRALATLPLGVAGTLAWVHLGRERVTTGIEIANPR
jgi:uncharacterized protein (TIRG00374 family)